MSVLGLIPARGQSKGVPRKNLRLLGGKPLLAWTATVALQSDILDRVLLSTEDAEIADLGATYGLEIQYRPPKLARDDTPMAFVIDDVVMRARPQPEILVLLQPTSPFRNPALIKEAVDKLRSTGADLVCSVAMIPAHYSPDFAFRVSGDGKLRAWNGQDIPSRRQDCRPAFTRTGDVYAYRVDALLKHRNVYENCQPILVDRCINLDTEEDWQEAERLLASKEAVHA